MKNIRPRQREENYFKTLKLLQIHIGKLCRFTEALVRLAEKDIKRVNLWSDSICGAQTQPDPRRSEPSKRRRGIRKAATGCCCDDIMSCRVLMQLAASIAASPSEWEKLGITHIWQRSCPGSLGSAALVSTKSVGSHTWNVIIADVDEWEFNGGTDGIYWTIVGRVSQDDGYKINVTSNQKP